MQKQITVGKMQIGGEGNSTIVLPAERKSSLRRDALTILFKHKLKIVVTFGTTVATIVIATLLLDPVYQATATVLVKFGRENLYRSEIGEKDAWVSLSHEEMVNSEIQILTSQDLIERVVKTIGPQNIYPLQCRKLRQAGKSEETQLAAASAAFKAALSVEAVKKSNVIQVSFQHGTADMAAQAVNLLVECFKEKHLRVHSDPKSNFLEQQFTSYKNALQNAEDELEAYKQENRTFSLPEQKTLLLQQRTNFDSELKNTRNRVAELSKRLNSLKRQEPGIPVNIPLSTVTERNEIVDNIKSTLLGLQLKERDLLMKYREDNPLVINVRKEIQIVEKYLNAQENDLNNVQTKGRNFVHQELEKEIMTASAELAAQESKASELVIQVAELQREIQSLDLKEKKLLQLQRTRDTNEKNYNIYLEKAEEARILEDMNRRKMANVSVIQKGATPLAPIRPRRNFYIVFAVVFGAIGGLGFALFCEYAEQGFTTPEQVEKRLDLHVLTSLPYDPLATEYRVAGIRTTQKA